MGAGAAVFGRFCGLKGHGEVAAEVKNEINGQGFADGGIDFLDAGDAGANLRVGEMRVFFHDFQPPFGKLYARGATEYDINFKKICVKKDP